MKHNGKFWLIMAVFNKGYGKFRLIPSVPLSEIATNSVRLHAILVRQSAMADMFSVEVPDMQRKESVEECLLNSSAVK